MGTRDLRSERGQSLVFFLVLLLGLIAFVGLVIDGASAFGEKRQVQNAADAAALAAVHDLGPALDPSCNAACLAAVDAAVAATASSYSAQNGGASPLPKCASASDTNCYQWPYNGNSGKVEVRLKNTAEGFFGNVLGLGNTFFKPRGRAVAGVQSITQTHCFVDMDGDGTYETQRDDLLPGCTLNGPPTGGENPVLMFVKDTACKAVHIVAADTTNYTIFYGAIVVNGHYDIDPGAQGDLLRWRTVSGCAGNLPSSIPPSNGAWKPAPNTIGPRAGGTQGKIEQFTTPLDWPTPNPTITSCAVPTPSNCTPTGTPMVQERRADGTVAKEEPCRKADGSLGVMGDWAVDQGSVTPGRVYCSNGKITIKNGGTYDDPSSLGVALVASQVIFEAGVKLKPFQGLYAHGTPGDCGSIGGLFVFAWDNGDGVKAKGDLTWGGGIFIPNGTAHVSGKFGTSTYGFVQALLGIDWGADGAIFYGTGDCVSGGGPGPPLPTRIVTTVTPGDQGLDE